eukprot:c18253_g1_i1.p1 GENE.c18253_g1_i1~~c18253_g1_i1.p1  ORF type:complete len:320 (-),score=129.21 c18253_g1_i1:27-953(-)
MELPQIGFGTMVREGVSVTEALTLGLKAGYRHIDTAELYANTKEVSEAIEQSKINRNELFITCKLKGLPCEEFSVVRDRVVKMLNDLKIEKFDLLLIHWAGKATADLNGDPSQVASDCDFNWFSENIEQAWKNMLQLKNQNLTNNIGVSNFYSSHINQLIQKFPDSKDQPFANQIYIDPCHQEKEFVSELQSLNVKVMAYRSLAFIPVYKMSQEMGDNTFEILEKQSQELGMTIHQFVLAWLIKRGIYPILSSSSGNHLEENLKASSMTEKISLDCLQQLEGGNETIEMMGGVDEFARVFQECSKPKQ